MKSKRFWRVKEANTSLPIHLLISPEYLQTFRFHSNQDLELVFQINLAYPVRILRRIKIFGIPFLTVYGHRLGEQLSPKFTFWFKGHYPCAHHDNYELCAEEQVALTSVKRHLFEHFLTPVQRAGKESLTDLGQRFDPPLVFLTDLIPNYRLY